MTDLSFDGLTTARIWVEGAAVVRTDHKGDFCNMSEALRLTPSVELQVRKKHILYVTMRVFLVMNIYAWEYVLFANRLLQISEHRGQVSHQIVERV